MSVESNEHPHGDPVYLYAIVPSEPMGHDVIAGMDAVADRLTTIGEGRYSAIVGNDPGGELKGRSRQELGHLLVAHQKVIEQLMRTAPVLPVKFGTQAPDEMGVRKALERGGRLFETAFAELKGRTQLEVLITWDLDAVFADIAAEEPVKRLKAQLATNAAGPASPDREALGRLVKEALERRRASLASHMLEAIRAVAIDVIVNPVTADRVVLHLTLLLKSDALDEIDRCLEKLDAAYGGRLGFRCVGPMPPASFATVEIEFLKADEIARASRILEVDPAARLDDVRSAYHRLARGVHPDTADSYNDSAQSMAALTQAYKLLSRYTRASEAADGSVASSLFESDGSTCAVLVSVRRQDATSGAAVIGAGA